MSMGRVLRFCVLLLTTFVLISCRDAQAATPSQFEYTVPLEISPETKGLVSLRLPLDAYPAVRSTADLRIFDAGGREVPFYLYFYGGGRASVEMPVEVFNMGVLEWKEQSFEFTLPAEIKEASSVRLVIGDASYNHQVALYGREENSQPFRLIKQGMRIVRLRSEDEALRYEYNQLTFPVQQLRNFRVVFSLDSEHPPLKVQEVRVAQTNDLPMLRQDAAISVTETDPEKNPFKAIPSFRQRESLKRSTFYELYPHPGGLPLDTIVFETGSGEFLRRATLYGLDPKDRRVGAVLSSGSLFSLGSEKHLSLTLTPSRSAAYLLEVFQGDNLPITISGASGSFLACDVKFFVEAGKNKTFQLPYTLYYGTSAPVVPQYDIQDRISRMQPVAPQYVTAAAIVRNGAYTVPQPMVPTTEKTPAILYGAVGLLAVILVMRLTRLAKELPRDN